MQGAARHEILVRGVRPQGEREREREGEEQYSLCLAHLSEVLLLHSDRPRPSTTASPRAREGSAESSSVTMTDETDIAALGSINDAIVEGAGEGGAEDLLVDEKTKTGLDPALDVPPDSSLPYVASHSHGEDVQSASSSNPCLGLTRKKKKSRQKARRAVPSYLHLPSADTLESLSARASVSVSESVPVPVSMSLTEDAEQEQNQDQNSDHDQGEDCDPDPDPMSFYSFSSMFSDILTKKRVEVTE